MQATLQQLTTQLFTRFFDERTGMIYSYDVPDRDSVLPTPAEAAAGIPSSAAWGTGVEDCAMNGALLLAALAEAGDKQQASRVFAGLNRLLAATPERGFVPRGLLPDGRSHYAATSGDQTNMTVYGLWRYWQSPLPTDAERQAIREILAAMAGRLQRDGFRLTNEDGTLAGGGDLLSLRPGQPMRLLSILLAAHTVTGDPHWRRLYEERAAEQDGARLQSLCGTGADPFPPGWGFYAPEQLQAQLCLLSECDPDAARRELYQTARADVAARILRVGFPSLGHTPTYTEETLSVLGESAFLDSPFQWTRYDPEILARAEDWSWRAACARHPRNGEGLAWALEFVLAWMGSRPAFCHERNCVRFPLTAFHVALLGADARTRARVAAECRRLFARVDFSLCRWADTLVEATAVAALLAGAGESEFGG